MRPLIFVTLFSIVAHSAISQDLKKVKLTKEERETGVTAKYLGYGKGYHGSRFLLFLNADKTYRFEEFAHIYGELFNAGTWSKKNGQQ